MYTTQAEKGCGPMHSVQQESLTIVYTCLSLIIPLVFYLYSRAGSSKEDKATPAHWAILIGVNFYIEDRCLEGCVRDVGLVKEYLENGNPEAEKTPVDIKIFTATTPKDTRHGVPPESEEHWPTSANVCASLLRIIENAKPGNFVYIHFSGHGSRISSTDSEPGDSGQLALVLLERNGCSYLRGKVLANAIKKMVDAELKVTLVLDCCFSGSFVRGDRLPGLPDLPDLPDIQIRYTKYRPELDALHPVNPHRDFFDAEEVSRNALISNHKWLIDPNGYNTLAACGPHEESWELRTEMGEKHGALSYFLNDALHALRKSGLECTHESLYNHLLAKFHAHWPSQIPMRYGHKGSSFFGGINDLEDTAFISLYKTDDGPLSLKAGHAHGICEGDQFVIFPFNAVEPTIRQDTDSVVVEVVRVQDLTSELVLIKPTPATTEIISGWKAKLRSSLSPRKISIRLLGTLSEKKTLWMKQLERVSFLRLCSEDEVTAHCIFNITLNASDEYEIINGVYGRIPSLPSIPYDMPEALDAVLNTLNHLATFKYFEGIENRTANPAFERSFSITPMFEPGINGTFEVRSGAIWGFTVQNLGEKPLYLAIFNLNPSWEICNLESFGGGGEFQVIPPKGDYDSGNGGLEIEMHVPDVLVNMGQNQCEDIIKVFVTGKPTTFSFMGLPEIPLDAKRLAKLGRRMGGDLSDWLADLSTYAEGRQESAQDGWTVKNFIIHTAKGS